MVYRVAVTTSDKQNVNLHFGDADAFCIYELSESGKAHFVEVRNIPAEWINAYRLEMQSKGCCGKNEGYITSIARLLGDCKYLLTEKIGPHPYKAMQSKGISCLEISCPITEALNKISEYQSKIICNSKKRNNGIIKVAIASTDGKVINQHFGRAEQFYIVQLTEENYKYVETRNVCASCTGGNHETGSFDNTAKILEDCSVILVSRIGPGAYDFLTHRGFKVMEAPGVISEVLQEIFYT